jgi:hypothetical protein
VRAVGALGLAGRRALLLSLSLASSLRALAIRAGDTAATAAHAAMAGGKQAVAAFRSAVTAIDDAAIAQGRRVGAAMRATSRAMQSGAALAQRGMTLGTREAARASVSLERKVLGAAGQGRAMAARGAHTAVNAIHHAESSLFAGVVRFCRDASAEMAHTVLIVKVPTAFGAVPHVGRGWVLATAGGMIVLALVTNAAQFQSTSRPWTDFVARGDSPAPASAAIASAGIPREALPFLAGNAVTAVTPLRSTIRQVSLSYAFDGASTPSPGDRRAIQAVLNQYRDALSVLDVAGVKGVWPSARPEIVRAGFAGLVEQNIEFERCLISPAGTLATAACAGIVESGFSAGNRRPKIARTRWEFRLQKTGSRWMITAVDVLPG